MKGFNMRKKIWICIERGDNNCSAFAPEVPGCIATGKTVEDTRERMTAALASHLAWMAEDGDSLDGIRGAFPPADDVEDGDYCCPVKVEVAEPVEA